MTVVGGYQEQSWSTFNEGAFHISLQDPHTDPDYLPLSLYNDILPYYTIPMW